MTDWITQIEGLETAGKFEGVSTPKGTIFRHPPFDHYQSNNFDDLNNTGWKFHLSVAPRDLSRAWDIVVEQLSLENMPLAAKVVSDNRSLERMSNPENTQAGKHITIYMDGGTDPARHAELIQRIESEFRNTGIQPGPRQHDDKPVSGSKYAGYRNDRDMDGEYLDKARMQELRTPQGSMWNPLGKPDPYLAFSIQLHNTHPVRLESESSSTLDNGHNKPGGGLSGSGLWQRFKTSIGLGEGDVRQTDAAASASPPPSAPSRQEGNGVGKLLDESIDRMRADIDARSGGAQKVADLRQESPSSPINPDKFPDPHRLAGVDLQYTSKGIYIPTTNQDAFQLRQDLLKAGVSTAELHRTSALGQPNQPVIKIGAEDIQKIEKLHGELQQRVRLESESSHRQDNDHNKPGGGSSYDDAYWERLKASIGLGEGDVRQPAPAGAAFAAPPAAENHPRPGGIMAPGSTPPPGVRMPTAPASAPAQPAGRTGGALPPGVSGFASRVDRASGYAGAAKQALEGDYAGAAANAATTAATEAAMATGSAAGKKAVEMSAKKGFELAAKGLPIVGGVFRFGFMAAEVGGLVMDGKYKQAAATTVVRGAAAVATTFGSGVAGEIVDATLGAAVKAATGVEVESTDAAKLVGTVGGMVSSAFNQSAAQPAAAAAPTGPYSATSGAAPISATPTRVDMSALDVAAMVQATPQQPLPTQRPAVFASNRAGMKF